ncbi:MAG: macro domain-containing protein [Candidatus Omnitrophota bacterium]
MIIKQKIDNIILECVQGDIAQQPDMDAIVNAANADLMPGGGVAGAIHSAAGSGLAQECRAYAPIKPGQAVITSAHNLPNKYIIHCLGPVYGIDMPSDKLLASCYDNALRLAEENQISSIAFCAISAGIFGYPMPEALEIGFSVIKQKAKQLKSLKKIRFVLFSEKYLPIAEKVLARVLS